MNDFDTDGNRLDERVLLIRLTGLGGSSDQEIHVCFLKQIYFTKTTELLKRKKVGHFSREPCNEWHFLFLAKEFNNNTGFIQITKILNKSLQHFCFEHKPYAIDFYKFIIAQKWSCLKTDIQKMETTSTTLQKAVNSVPPIKFYYFYIRFLHT